VPKTEPQQTAETLIDPHAGGELPSAWAQAYPRAVTLAAGGMLVPASTLRVLLGRGKRLPLSVVGFSAVPWIEHGQEVQVVGGCDVSPGDLALCDIRGWAELRRILSGTRGGPYRTALDVLPGVFEEITGERVLGVVDEDSAVRRGLERFAARVHPVTSRIASLIYWCKKIGQAPGPPDDEIDTIGRKYAWQVKNYQSILQVPLGDWTRDLVARHVPRGGSLLVPGSGVGREALHLARLGYHVLGVDLIPAMVEASRENAARMGLDAEFLAGDIATLDLGERRFDGIFMTALVYSFIPGRSRRVACLRNLGRHLTEQGVLMYSAHLVHRFEHLARLMAVAARRRLQGDRKSEFGDWFTWFVTPEGQLGKAFSHRFFAAGVRAEANEAGFRSVDAIGSDHFVAMGYAG
jgi:SAM-dependent methyltransferase